MTGNESVLLVFFGDKQMGEVHRQRGGELTFRYDEDYLREDEAVRLSLSMQRIYLYALTILLTLR